MEAEIYVFEINEERYIASKNSKGEVVLGSVIIGELGEQMNKKYKLG